MNHRLKIAAIVLVFCACVGVGIQLLERRHGAIFSRLIGFLGTLTLSYFLYRGFLWARIIIAALLAVGIIGGGIALTYIATTSEMYPEWKVALSAVVLGLYAFALIQIVMSLKISKTAENEN